VKVDNAGDGPAVDSNKQVTVIYTGMLFPSKHVFESNAGPGKEPIKFVIGRRQIIQGWDDGLRLFKKGGKGTLYIPSFLAYDAQPGPGRTPNENLIFDIQIVDVTDAPAEKPMNMPNMPAMPGGNTPGRPAPQPRGK
jgi:FKBP-type peptidyl-prolyl cis-trans isomerase